MGRQHSVRKAKLFFATHALGLFDTLQPLVGLAEMIEDLPAYG
jgi:hypothetical protein